MKLKAYDNLYNYYIHSNLNVSFKQLNTKKKFEKFKKSRHEFLSSKLGLTSLDFEGKKVLEFGPDVGENSLCFAFWGAKLTLVEPNFKAHQQIITC